MGRYINKRILAVKLINDIEPYALTCYDRSVCIASNSIRNYLIYGVLLFTHNTFRGSFGSRFQIGNDYTNITYEKCNGAEFYDHFTEWISKEIAVICCFDQYFHKLYHNSYQRKHRLHYTLIKGYDSYRNEVVTIDEDISYQEDNPKAIPIYAERKINAEILKDACINTATHIDKNPFSYVYKELFKDTCISYAASDNTNTVQLGYIKLASIDGNRYPYNIGIILDDYKEFLYQALTINSHIFRKMILRLSEMKDEGSLEVNLAGYLPWELRRFDAYERGYVVQERVFSNMLCDMAEYDTVRDSLNELIIHIRMMRLLLNKYSITRNNSEIDILIKKYFKELRLKEDRFIYQMIKFIEGSKEEMIIAMAAAIDDNVWY